MKYSDTIQNRTGILSTLLTLLISAVLFLPGCGGCQGCADRTQKEPAETEALSGKETEIKQYDFSGNLRIRSTDGSYLHEAIVTDSEGRVVATGDTGNPFPVPEGTFNVQVQGYTFPVTIERDRETLVSVQEEAGLGKLRMNAADGSYIHPVVVTDHDGNEIARGSSGFYIDLPPGKYRATMQERTVDVEIKKGETTYIRP